MFVLTLSAFYTINTADTAVKFDWNYIMVFPNNKQECNISGNFIREREKSNHS